MCSICKKSEILAEINNIQPVIKELRKYDKYCKNIKDRSKSMQNNLDTFDKDIQKEKDNLGHDDLNCLFNNIILPRAATATAGAASR